MFLVIVIVVIYFAYPYCLYRLCSLNRFGLNSALLIPHWVFNILFLSSLSIACLDSYSPTREVFLATQLAYWLPIAIMRYYRRNFTVADRFWIYGAYPFVFIALNASIYLYIDAYRLVARIMQSD